MFWLSVLTKIVLGLLAFAIPVGGEIAYIVKLVLSGNAEIQEVAAVALLVLTELTASLKLLDLRLRRGHLKRLMDQLITEETHYDHVEHIAIQERAVRMSRYVFIGMLSLCLFDVTVHSVVVPAVRGFQELPLKMDLLFFDISEKPYFIYICFYQILYKPVVVIMFIALVGIPWGSMLYTIGQLDILLNNFKKMDSLIKQEQLKNKCSEDDAFHQVFIKLLGHHQKIKSFVQKMQLAFSGLLFLEMAIVIGIVGTTAIQMLSIEITIKNMTDLFWVVVFLFIEVGMLFFTCYLGHTITAKSHEISTVAFQCPWLDRSLRLKKNLIIFITQTQQPLALVAAGLIPVSFETFTKVMNWTYKGFAVLNQMKK